jgi:predicted small metal-binding protein
MTKELHCGEVMKGCPTVMRGETEEEVMKKAAEHAREAHGVAHMDERTIQAVKARIREA